MQADLILCNARVLTMDPMHPRAELVAIKSERILAVGGRELYQIKGPRTQLIDCSGGALIPGFIDAHCHVMALAGNLLSIPCGSKAVTAILQIQQAIRQRSLLLPPGSWIRASDYNEFYLAEKRHPNRWDLDQAAPHHPVRLTHRTRHALVLNSLGLAMAGITRDTPDPVDGIIERDEHGEPTGLLFGMNAHISEVMPPLAEEELREGIALAAQEYLSLGITSIQDATVRNGPAQWEAFRRLKAEGLLPTRVTMMMGFQGWGELQERGLTLLGDESLHLGAVKIMLDETTGSLKPPQEELEEQVSRIHRAGWQAALHAIEASTVGAAILAYAKALERESRPGHRHRIEHCSLCPEHLLPRMRKLGLVVVTQPPFLYYSGERYLAQVPPEELISLYRIRSLLKIGIPVAASSDSPVVPPNPLMGIYAAVTRRAESGQALNLEECITPLEALNLYTLGAAYASFEEDVKGSIEAGKLADLVLLSDDPTSVPAEAIKEIKVETTIMGGKLCWQKAT